jgi:hypothetical protein
MKNKKYHTVGTIQISNRKLMERGKNDTTITQIHRIFADYRLRHLVNNVAIHIYVYHMITLEWSNCIVFENFNC